MTDDQRSDQDHEPDTDATRGATRLADVIARADSDGFGAEFEVADDTDESDSDALRCPVCERTDAAGKFARTWRVRLEGASDPADMLHVSALTCPNCGADGVFVSPFGPAATERQAAVLSALPPPSQEPSAPPS